MSSYRAHYAIPLTEPSRIELAQVEWQRADADFTLSIPRLELHTGITLLAGRNGAGKSTLLQLLATALMPRNGAILYNGLATMHHLPIIRARIGFVPTGLELYEEMKVSRLLRYLASLKGGASPESMAALLEQFGLAPYQDRKIKTLAHGIRQRIALAQAWLGDPPYLFLDEPLNAMDSLERLAFIRQLAVYARNRTVIVSTHELNEWECWAEELIWIDEGRIHFHGATDAWRERLPLKIWEGWASADTYSRLSPSAVLHVRTEGSGYALRMMGETPPLDGFTEQAITLEDAYFIRCRGGLGGYSYASGLH